MSLRNRFTGFIVSLGLIAAFSVAAGAQQAAPADKAARQPKAEGMRRGGREHHGPPVLRIMRDLNLSDTQAQQARAITERFVNSIEPQRQALKELHQQREEQGTLSDDAREKAQGLRAQIDEARQSMQSELRAILTPEQRTQYEKLEQEWKARRAERHERRGRGERTLPSPPEEQ